MRKICAHTETEHKRVICYLQDLSVLDDRIYYLLEFFYSTGEKPDLGSPSDSVEYN